MTTKPEFNHRSPDYISIYAKQQTLLTHFRADPRNLAAAWVYYKENPADWICDWCITYNPANLDEDLDAFVPFVLFPKQRECVNWIVAHWKNKKPGVIPKTRQIGMSFVTVAVAVWMAVFHEGVTVGFCSRKEEDVDKAGSLGSLLEKCRLMADRLPPEFQAGYSKATSPSMIVGFPQSKSTIRGASGDKPFRGSTCSIIFIDEAAHLEHPEVTEMSVSAAAKCRMYVSTPNGTANTFYQNFISYDADDKFLLHWRDDPRKYFQNPDGTWNEDWYKKQQAELDPVTIAQEIDIDFSASVEGILIPSAWIQAAVNSHVVLGISNSGSRMAALDIADEGKDKNALCLSYGFLIEQVEEWTGKNSDILHTIHKAFALCDEHEYEGFYYDSDGMGVGARGDTTHANNLRKERGERLLTILPFRGSGHIVDPDKEQFAKGRKNKDTFANAKAQGWWTLRQRFQKTFRAVTERHPINPEDLISISSECKNLSRLLVELSQPTYKFNTNGKMLVEKTPKGAKSPNLADAVMIRFSPKLLPIQVPHEATARFSTPMAALPRGVASRFSNPRPLTSAILQRFKKR